MLTHFAGCSAVGSIVWLIGYAIAQKERTRRLLLIIATLALIALVAFGVWWFHDAWQTFHPPGWPTPGHRVTS